MGSEIAVARPPRAAGGQSCDFGSHCSANSDRKSTRLNSSHLGTSYAVFCLKKKNRDHPLVARLAQVATRLDDHWAPIVTSAGYRYRTSLLAPHRTGEAARTFRADAASPYIA